MMTNSSNTANASLCRHSEIKSGVHQNTAPELIPPEGDIGNFELADIIDARAIQSLMDNFYLLAKMPMAIINLHGTILVDVGWRDVCTKFHQIHPETCRNCIEIDTQLSADIPYGELKLYKRRNNLWDMATPIVVAGKHVGNIFTGQFLFEDEPLDYDGFTCVARENGFDERQLIAALEAVPRLKRDSLNTGMTFFLELADILSKLSYSNLKLARSLSERETLMAELRQVHDELEGRVKERTEELSATVVILQKEIDERQRAETNLLRLNRLYEVLSETNKAIIRARDRDSLFTDFCRIAVEHGCFRLSWVGLLDEENNEVRSAAAYGETGYLDGITVSVTGKPLGIGPTGLSIREGRYHICNDFQNDPCTKPWHERGRAHGIKSSASVVLREDGRIIGALTLYAGETGFFDRQQVDLLVQMGADISFALDNMAREARRQNAEQALQAETLGRLRAVESLREKEQMLIQQNRQAAMGEMIGNIAHQWRQPLNVLALLVQQIKLFYDMGSLSKEDLHSCISKSMDSINHMSQTIDDFRNFFKPDKEKVAFLPHEVIAKTVALVEDSFRNEQIRITVNAVATPPITGFPNEYSQVVLNILMNARDALQEKRPAGAFITITISTKGKKTVVAIADNAGGIKKDIIDKIFEPYFTTKEPDKGTGVGLFMAKTIIEKNMNGKLSVRNTPAGAEFKIEV